MVREYALENFSALKFVEIYLYPYVQYIAVDNFQEPEKDVYREVLGAEYSVWHVVAAM